MSLHPGSGHRKRITKGDESFDRRKPAKITGNFGGSSRSGARSKDDGRTRGVLDAVNDTINRRRSRTKRRDTSVRTETIRQPKGDGTARRRSLRSRRPGILRGFRDRK